MPGLGDNMVNIGAIYNHPGCQSLDIERSKQSWSCDSDDMKSPVA